MVYGAKYVSYTHLCTICLGLVQPTSDRDVDQSVTCPDGPI